MEILESGGRRPRQSPHTFTHTPRFRREKLVYVADFPGGHYPSPGDALAARAEKRSGRARGSLRQKVYCVEMGLLGTCRIVLASRSENSLISLTT